MTKAAARITSGSHRLRQLSFIAIAFAGAFAAQAVVKIAPMWFKMAFSDGRV